MIRRVQINVSYANKGKLSLLDDLFTEAQKVINLYIEVIWNQKDFKSKFVTFKVDTWLSARLQQCLGKQALEIVKSQRKKHKKTMPLFHRNVINLDSRFVDFQFDKNSFDLWIKLTSLGNKLNLKLPSHKHKHFHHFSDWNVKQSVRLRKSDSGYFIDLYFEKDAPELKPFGKEIGVDCGYKKLLVTSEAKVFDTGLEEVYEKISRKKQGSKRFKEALAERDNKINESLNKIAFEEIKTIIAEDLKEVKKESKGKIHKKFNNKLQRWSYPKVLGRLELHCEEQGILFMKVNPAYTSQTCCICGHTHRNNRFGEKFLCLSCGYEADADYNAAVNILHRGAYSPPTTKNILI